METSLHRELKSHYADADARTEVRLGRYRIDAISDGRLIEIQHGSLSAIRDKIAQLLEDHEVTVVKPIVARKRLVKLDAKGGEPLSSRWSPKRGQLIDLFEELVYFTRVFPHPRLVLEVPLVEVEEWRYPGHGRRRRRREQDFQVADQKLVSIEKTVRLKTGRDLRRMLGCRLPTVFHTGDLAHALGVRRRTAQRVAYCFRKMGIAETVDKQGNAILYRYVKGNRKAA